MMLELNNSLFVVIITISVILISISYFINSKLIAKDHTQKTSNVFLIFFLANCIALGLGRLLLEQYVFIVAGVPFVIFYGPMFYLFLRTLIINDHLEKKDNLGLLHFLIPLGFASFYLGSIMTYSRLSISFIQHYYFYLYFIAALLLGFYGFYGFYILHNNTFSSVIKALILRVVGLFFLVSMLLCGVVLYQKDPFMSQNLVSIGLLVFAAIIFLFYKTKINAVEHRLGERRDEKLAAQQQQAQVNLADSFIESLVNHGSNAQIVVADSADIGAQALGAKAGFVAHVLQGGNQADLLDSNGLSDPEAEQQDAKQNSKYGKSRLSGEILQLYELKIQKVLVEDKAYLDFDFSVEKLADATNLQRHHIAQVFSFVYQSNFNAYVNQLRVEKALKILEADKERLNVSELAERCGFNSRTSFFRAFKKHTQMSPSEYILYISQFR